MPESLTVTVMPNEAGDPIAAAIETLDLSKQYLLRASRRRSGTPQGENAAPTTVEAVRGVTLRIPPGEIYALLGPNGAGKTTLLSMLTTLLQPTGGTARVAGFDVVGSPAEVRRRIGVTFQEIVLDKDLTGRQALDFHARLYGMPAAERHQRLRDVAALVELSDVLDRSVGSYSGGMKRRLELARGLMTRPSVLFLDEPTQGLDLQNRASVWRYVRTLRDQFGMTILLTTHYMEEAEALADRVGIIDHGRLILEGAPAKLVRTLGADVVQLTGSGDETRLQQRLDELPFVQRVASIRLDADALGQPAGFRLQIGVDHGERRVAQVVTLAADAGVAVHEVSVARPSLGDVFLAHTGHALRDSTEA